MITIYVSFLVSALFSDLLMDKLASLVLNQKSSFCKNGIFPLTISD